MADDEPIPTRASMLQRLKNPADQATWDDFNRTYRGLIRGVARRAGLDETEAEEVVQETLIAVARKMPEFHYLPAKDSFKGWLLQLTHWRIADQLRKRPKAGPEPFSEQSSAGGSASARSDLPDVIVRMSHGDDNTAGTATVDRIPDPAGPALTAIWDEEWAKHLVNTALARVKRRVNPAHYEIYHLHVILGKSASEVRQALGVSITRVYLAKHRVGALVRKELRKLRDHEVAGEPR
jgi:RNA polymerase sigma factor (sigma-70 family)